MVITRFLRPAVAAFILGIFSLNAGVTADTDNDAVGPSCTTDCMRVAFIKMYHTPPSITAKVTVVGEEDLGLVRGCFVYGNFTTPTNETVPVFGHAGNVREARLHLYQDEPGEYLFEVTDIVKEGYTFDPEGSDTLTGNITIGHLRALRGQSVYVDSN